MMYEAAEAGNYCAPDHLLDPAILDNQFLSDHYGIQVMLELAVDKKDSHFKYISKKKELLNLSELDVILIRQDPPFDMNYITSTYLLEQLPPSTVVLNNPISIRNSAEKIYPIQFQIQKETSAT